MRLHLAPARPMDLYVALAWTGLAVAVVAAGWSGPFRVMLALPVVLFWPGYTLTAGLFPERFRSDTFTNHEGEEEETRQGIDGLERTALSLGLSIAVVPLLGLGLNFTPFGIRLASVVTTLALFILVSSIVAFRRRAGLPPEDWFRVELHVETTPWRAMRGLDRALTVVLALSILAAATTLVYVLTNPRPGERFTEFYILGPGGKATGYPDRLAPDEEGLVLVGVVNHEGESIDYEVSWNRAQYSDDPAHEVDPNATAPPSETTGSFSTFLADEGNVTRPLTFSLPDEGLWRVGFELRRPGDDEPYRRLHLWVRVR